MLNKLTFWLPVRFPQIELGELDQVMKRDPCIFLPPAEGDYPLSLLVSRCWCCLLDVLGLAFRILGENSTCC